MTKYIKNTKFYKHNITLYIHFRRVSVFILVFLFFRNFVYSVSLADGFIYIKLLKIHLPLGITNALTKLHQQTQIYAYTNMKPKTAQTHLFINIHIYI